jgi:transcriptional regulator with XRE-family HTH domain
MPLTVNYTLRIVANVTGHELRQIRKRLGLTQQKMAEQVGITANSLARQERGEQRISEPQARLVRLLVDTALNKKRTKQ